MTDRARAGYLLHARNEFRARFGLAGLECFPLGFTGDARAVLQRRTRQRIGQQEFTIANVMCRAFEQTASLRHFQVTFATHLINAFKSTAFSNVCGCAPAGEYCCHDQAALKARTNVLGEIEMFHAFPFFDAG
jgi:hypothetical protein